MTESIAMEPIGTFHTLSKERYEVPQQAGLVKKSGVIELLPHHNFEVAVEDLSGFERIWVIYAFHRNETWKPKVLPPRGGVKRGVFATRSPHRPNPIGLSCLRLQRVEKRKIWVEDPDLLDGTPILDIKPYIDYADCFPGTRQGWVEELPEQLNYRLVWSPGAEEDRKRVLEESGKDLGPVIESRLQTDPFPYPNRRIYRSEKGFFWRCQYWRIDFQVDKDRAEVYIKSIALVADPA